MIINEDIHNSRGKPEEITGVIDHKKKSNQNYEFTGIKYPKKNKPIFEDPVDTLLYNINNYNNYVLLINKLDFYGNSIPLGAFCFAISYIMYGFYDCKVHKNVDIFLYIIFLLFGGIGQMIAGLLEYIKGRTFPSNLYLIYGIYCISFFIIKYPFKEDYSYNKECIKFYYGSWAGLTFPLFIASFKTNAFYLLQTILVCAIFVIRCIGECYDVEPMNRLVPGILELIAGFISLYICINQIINEIGIQVLPSLCLKKDNEIDPDKEN